MFFYFQQPIDTLAHTTACRMFLSNNAHHESVFTCFGMYFYVFYRVVFFRPFLVFLSVFFIFLHVLCTFKISYDFFLKDFDPGKLFFNSETLSHETPACEMI